MWPFDQNNQQMYQQYAQSYDTGNYYGIDQNQAMAHVQQFMQNAPWQMQQQIYQQHFEQMPYEQRVQYAQQMPPQYSMNPNDPQGMAQSFHLMGQQQPNMLLQILGQGGYGQGGVAGLAGLIARHVLGNQGGGQFGNMYGGGQQYSYRQGDWDDERREGYRRRDWDDERREDREDYRRRDWDDERREDREDYRREDRDDERREDD